MTSFIAVTTILSFLLLVCTLAGPNAITSFHLDQTLPPQSTTIETVYNEAKDETTVRLPRVRISGDKDRYHSLDFSVYYTYQGQTKTLPEQVSFELVSVVKARKLNSDLYVQFLLDGVALHFGSNRSAIMKPVPGRLWIGERMIFRIPCHDFLKMASAESIQITLGDVSFELSDEARDSVRAFAEAIKK